MHNRRDYEKYWIRALRAAAGRIENACRQQDRRELNRAARRAIDAAVRCAALGEQWSTKGEGNTK